MSIFRIFHNDENLERFVKESIDQFCESFSVKHEIKYNDKKIYKKYDKAVNRLKLQLFTYRKDNKLSVYKKAKLISLTMQEMERRGFSEDIVKDIRQRVTVYLTST